MPDNGDHSTSNTFYEEVDIRDLRLRPNTTIGDIQVDTAWSNSALNDYEIQENMRRRRPHDTMESIVVEQAFETFSVTHVHEMLIGESFNALVDELFDNTRQSIENYVTRRNYSVPDAVFEKCGDWHRLLVGWFGIYLDNECPSIDVPNNLHNYLTSNVEDSNDPRSNEVDYEPDIDPTSGAGAISGVSLQAYYIADAMGLDITTEQASQVNNVQAFVRDVGNSGHVEESLLNSVFGRELHPETLSKVAPPNEWPEHMDPANITVCTCDACGTGYRRIYTEYGNEVFANGGDTVDRVERPERIDEVIPRRALTFVCSECINRTANPAYSSDKYVIISGSGACCVKLSPAFIYSDSGFGDIGASEVEELLEGVNQLTQITVSDRLRDEVFDDEPDIGIPTNSATVIIRRRHSPVSEPTDTVHVDSDDFESVQVAKHIVNSTEGVTIDV